MPEDVALHVFLQPLLPCSCCDMPSHVRLQYELLMLLMVQFMLRSSIGKLQHGKLALHGIATFGLNLALAP